MRCIFFTLFLSFFVQDFDDSRGIVFTACTGFMCVYSACFFFSFVFCLFFTQFWPMWIYVCFSFVLLLLFFVVFYTILADVVFCVYMVRSSYRILSVRV